ncbi:hypothetical protein AAGG49_23055, partial [Stenotrophomonas maltophilia]
GNPPLQVEVDQSRETPEQPAANNPQPKNRSFKSNGAQGIKWPVVRNTVAETDIYRPIFPEQPQNKPCPPQ